MTLIAHISLLIGCITMAILASLYRYTAITRINVVKIELVLMGLLLLAIFLFGWGVSYALVGYLATGLCCYFINFLKKRY